MSSNFYIAMKNNKGTCVLMYAVLHGIAHIPAGEAQNRAQNELKMSSKFDTAMKNNKGTCVWMYLLCMG